MIIYSITTAMEASIEEKWVEFMQKYSNCKSLVDAFACHFLGAMNCVV